MKMQKRSYAILAGAALAAAPAISKAVPSITFSYDTFTASNIEYSTASTFPTGSSTTTTILNNAVTIPINDYFRFGVDAVVGNNPNAASGGAFDQANSVTEPATLGLATFGFLFNNSNPAILAPVGTGAPAFALTKFPAAVASPGKGEIAIGTVGQIGAAGQFLSGVPGNITSYNPTSTATYADVNSFASNSLIFSNVVYKAGAISGQSVITANIPAGADSAVILDPSYTSAATNTNAPDYIGTQTVNVTNLAALTVNVTGGTGTTVTAGSQKIISLVTGTAPTGTPPNGYGSAAMGTLTVQNAGGPGKYFPGYFNIPGGATSGFIALAGFLPGDAPEIAIQVAIGGVVLSPTDTRLAAIIADIKGSDANISTGVTTVAGSPFAGIFPGYDILLPSSIAATGSPFFAFDFSNSGTDLSDTDVALGPVTVTSIAAVPEPATAAGVILSAAGLLLGRRKKRVEIAA